MSAKWTFWAWEQPIQTAPKKLALLQLANNANDDGKSWYSIVKMAKSCGVSERTFQRQIKDLEGAGLLHVERRSNRPSIYVLKDEMEITLTDRGDTMSGRGDRVTGQGDTESPLGVSESRPILTLDPNTNLNNKDLLSGKPDSILVLQYLNYSLDTKYQVTTQSHLANISARLKDGYSVDDCKKVIDSKKIEWGEDPKMAQYLRPQTLFGNKFQGYLVAAKMAPKKMPVKSVHSFEDQIYQSGEF